MILVASDHAGYELKVEAIKFITMQYSFSISDLGPNDTTSVDYADYANALCEAIIRDSYLAKGILICGTGVGMSIAANRWKGIRCALATTPHMAKMAREHNDANVLALGARILDSDTAFACVSAFLSTSYEGGRHDGRLAKIVRGHSSTEN